MIWKKPKKAKNYNNNNKATSHGHNRCLYSVAERRTPLRTGKMEREREKSNWMRRKILKLLVSNCNNFHYYFFVFSFFFLVSNLLKQHVAQVFLFPHTYVSRFPSKQAWTHWTHPYDWKSYRLAYMCFFNGCKRLTLEQFQIYWPFAVSPASSKNLHILFRRHRRTVDGPEQEQQRFLAFCIACVKRVAASTSPSSLYHNH